MFVPAAAAAATSNAARIRLRVTLLRPVCALQARGETPG